MSGLITKWYFIFDLIVSFIAMLWAFPYPKFFELKTYWKLSELNFSIYDINARYENIQSKTDIHLLSPIKLNQKSEKINILRKNDRVTISFNEDIKDFMVISDKYMKLKDK